MQKALAGFGVGISVLYLVAAAWAMEGRFQALQTMPLNEVGDFLAGVFSPLAFFWLVLGFFQQGKELGASRAALSLQALELKNSVERQKELVEITRQQHEAEVEERKAEQLRKMLAAQPVLIMEVRTTRISNGTISMRGSVYNSGHQITKVRYEWDTPVKIDMVRETVLSRNQRVEFRMEASAAEIQTFLFKILFLDGLQNQRTKMFIFEPANGDLAGFKVGAVEGTVVEA